MESEREHDFRAQIKSAKKCRQKGSKVFRYKKLYFAASAILDESGADLNTCMDYDDALGNPHPNNHDYQQLEIIYAHLDSSTTIASVPAGFANADVHAQENWGTKVRESADGRSAIFVRDFGDGNQIFTFVFWAE